MPSLTSISLTFNQLTYLPGSICLLFDNWTGGPAPFAENYICTYIPECAEEYAPQQDCDWYIPGDSNQDGNIDILDITLVVSFILAFETPDQFQFINSDLSSDGSLDILDVVLLVNFILEE